MLKRRFGRPRYAPDPAGLADARAELTRREAVHAAFAGQSGGISPIWQRWIDQAARHAAEQDALVRRLAVLVHAKAAATPHQPRPRAHRPRPGAS